MPARIGDGFDLWVQFGHGHMHSNATADFGARHPSRRIKRLKYSGFANLPSQAIRLQTQALGANLVRLHCPNTVLFHFDTLQFLLQRHQRDPATAGISAARLELFLLGAWAAEGVDAKGGPSKDSSCRVCRPIAVAMGQKPVKNEPLRPLCSRRSFCRPH
jgi:hypothetical protein